MDTRTCLWIACQLHAVEGLYCPFHQAEIGRMVHLEPPAVRARRDRIAA